MGDLVGGKRVLTAHPNARLAVDAVISASQQEQFRQKPPHSRNARPAAPGGGFRATLDKRYTSLLARILQTELPETTPVVQFVSCSTGSGTSGIAFATAQTAAIVLGRTLLIDARLDKGPDNIPDDGTSPQPNTSDILPDAFTPRLYHHRLNHCPAAAALLYGVGRNHALARLSAPFRFVVIDSPGPGNAPSANAFAPVCIGTILIVTAGETTRTIVQDTILQVTSGGGRIIGTILDRAPAHLPHWISAP